MRPLGGAAERLPGNQLRQSAVKENMRRSILVARLVATLVLAGCGDVNGPTDAEARPSGSITVLGGLVVTITLASTTVETGAELANTMTYENPTAAEIAVHDCRLWVGASAIAATGDPAPDLWLQPVVDCGGTMVVEPGGAWTGPGPTFLARTKYGQPLKPGTYEAVYQLEDQMLRLPVIVTSRS
ncbi:MAG TPA: hypothetical protein VJM33_11945 [Microthrixaceae bacterium]|nr:hypothetical protein [Microthrixaceae bacterium]